MSCISMNQNVFKLIEKADRDLADLVHNHPSWTNFCDEPHLAV
jgi:hypothetical protein